MRGWRRSRPRVRAASIAVLALGLAGGAVAVPGAAQARSLPTRSVAVSLGLTIYGGLGFGTTPIGTDRKLPAPSRT
jgi:hypothetical protein